MKLKKYLLGLMLGISSLVYSQQFVIDLSTGVYAPNNLIPNNVNDDNWEVKIPGSTTFQPVKSTTGLLSIGPSGGTNGAYPSIPNAKWVSHNTDIIGNIAAPSPIGFYEYRMTFMGPNCPIPSSASVKINLLKIGADNLIHNLKLNGVSWLSPTMGISFNSLSTQTIVNQGNFINVNQLNTITFSVENFGGSTGLFLYGNLTIDYGPALNVSLTSPKTNYCYGEALNLVGSTTSANITSYNLEVTESSASGVPISGGYNFTTAVNGSPGSLYYNGINNLACGKYYKILLSVFKACGAIITAQASKIIYIACNPSVNAGPDLTVCSGSIAVIGSGSVQNDVAYTWSDGVNSIKNKFNSPTINVFPTATTTYTLTATNVVTGCSSSDAVTVNVGPIAPFPTSLVQVPAGSALCVGGSVTYAFNTNVPASYNVVWSVSGNLVKTSSNNNSITAQVTAFGTGTISASITNNCGLPISIPAVITTVVQPTIHLFVCSGFPSVHPHWRFGFLQSTTTPIPSAYNWSGVGINFPSNTTTSYIIGVPSNPTFTVNCALTYACPSAPGGTVTYNVSDSYDSQGCNPPNPINKVVPNPTSSSANFEYSVTENGQVRIVLNNVNNESITLLNETKIAGDYSINLSEELLSKKGIYSLIVYVNNKLVAQKRFVKE
jgi:hypothetical protein